MTPTGIRKYWLFSIATVTVHLMRASLRWLGFSRTVGMLGRLAPPGAVAGTPPPDVREHPMVWAVRVAARRTLRERPCLPAALALVLFLRRSGIPAELEIGVEKPEGESLSAHAWVESGGVVVFGGEISPERYRPFSTLQVGSRPGSTGEGS